MASYRALLTESIRDAVMEEETMHPRRFPYPEELDRAIEKTIDNFLNQYGIELTPR